MNNAATYNPALGTDIPPELYDALESWLDSRWSRRADGEIPDSFNLTEFLADQLLGTWSRQVHGRPALALVMGRLDTELERQSALSEARQAQSPRPQHVGPTCCATDSDNVFAWLDAPGPQVLGRWGPGRWTS